MSVALDHDGPQALLERPSLARLLDVLDGRGEEVRVVGGAVRNALLGREVDEIDLTTTAVPEEVERRAKAAGLKVVPTGLEHGTVTVLVDGTPYEVTTLREDVETFGRRARVRFGRSFEADARRRDFTINALSLGRDGRIHDHTGGLLDLAERRVRFIGDPANRIREDYLRILRFFRFHAEYGDGPLDPSGREAAIRARAGLATLSRERVRAETLKLLRARRAVEVVGLIVDDGLAGLLFGGAVELGRLARVATTEALGPADPVLRLASLVVLVGEDAERLQECLRLSKAEFRRLSAYAGTVAALRSASAPFDRPALRRFVAEHGMEAVADGFAALLGEPRPLLTDEGRQAYVAMSAGAEPLPVFPLKGSDVVARGIPAGPEVGAVLGRARAAWLAAGCPEGEGVGFLEEALAADATPARQGSTG